MTLPIDGCCDARFARVRDAFASNFALHGEVGASVTVIVDGRAVVDLWGGHRDASRQTPWGRDTLVNVFSVSKALSTICALRLVERGLLDLDAPVARVWPEFAAGGKEGVTLRQILCHRAGLPAVKQSLPEGAALDWGRMTAALAAQEPWWTPGERHGYHVNTFGFLVGELVRRASGRSVGALLRDEVARPLEADVHIGLDAAQHARVAEFLWTADVPATAPDLASLPFPYDLRWQTYFNPPGVSGSGGWVNRAAWRSGELPSANGHASARGIARVFAALARGGSDGNALLAADTLAAAITEHACGDDLVLDRPTRFGLGFQLTQPQRPLGPNPRTFGHFGSGGALGFADPDAGLAFGYAMNHMGPRWQNPRNTALIEALYACL
ncbi:beta-lactamase family protein [Candidatus Binatia bacterium]|nr:beta-lactamase family protein [Candidatus Binatia bacterium]